MLPNTLFGLTSVVCFCLPILAILVFRLYRHASLIALMIYYGLTVLRCISSPTMPPLPDLKNTWEVLYTYIEIPLVMASLFFFCPARQRQQRVHLVLALFVGYEVAIAFLFCLTPAASVYITTPGLIMIVSYSLFLFLRQVRFTLAHRKNLGRVLMLGAILFAYSAYLFMVYAYAVLGANDISGIYALYFSSSSIAAVIMSFGLFLMRHRIKELQDLKVTRRELQMVFGS